ncbi:M48 family peptidase, partial [Burkholderia sp. Tr-20355]|nr:M48 family peptidase [Burkholderia sp. Tr-20355]
MRVKQLLAVSLSAALALPPGGHAQSTPAPPLEPATGGSPAISTVPSGIATGVFGTYGGAESRSSGAG